MSYSRKTLGDFGDAKEAGARTVGRWKVAKLQSLFVGYDAWTTSRVTQRSRRGKVQIDIGRNGASVFIIIKTDEFDAVMQQCRR